MDAHILNFILRIVSESPEKFFCWVPSAISHLVGLEWDTCLCLFNKVPGDTITLTEPISHEWRQTESKQVSTRYSTGECNKFKEFKSKKGV